MGDKPSKQPKMNAQQTADKSWEDKAVTMGQLTPNVFDQQLQQNYNSNEQQVTAQSEQQQQQTTEAPNGGQNGSAADDAFNQMALDWNTLAMSNGTCEQNEIQEQQQQGKEEKRINESQAKMDSLQTLLDDMAERLEQNVSNFGRLQSDMNALEEKLTKASEQQRTDRVRLEEKVDKLQRDVNALANQQTMHLAQQRTDRTQLDAQIANLNTAISSQQWNMEQNHDYLEHMISQCSLSMADLRGDKVRVNNEHRTQQQQIDKLKKTVDELMDQQKDICANISNMANSVCFLKGLVPHNRWDPIACHKDLTLFGSERLFVQHNGHEPGFRSVFAKWPVTKNHFKSFYYEVKIISKLSCEDIAVGLGPKGVKLDKFVALSKCTYAYDSSGTVWANGRKLKSRNRHTSECGGSSGHAFVGKRVPLWGEGDVVGCGFNLSTRQLLYTKNGERIDAVNLVATDCVELFAFVTLYHLGDKIEANFGPNFKYNFEDEI